jgi:hypothetical protein
MFGAPIVIVVLMAAPVAAQDSTAPASVKRLRQALQSPHSTLALPGSSPPWMTPDGTRRLGMLTLGPPKTPGEFVSVVVPVGELATRAVHALAGAQRRRAAKSARAEVARALQNLQQPRLQP